MTDMTEKKCNICGRTLPFGPENFFRNKSRKDGFMAYCKSCTLNYQKGTKGIREVNTLRREGNTDDTRCCTYCSEVFPLGPEHFHKHSGPAYRGFAYSCKSCTAKYAKKWGKDNPYKLRLGSYRHGDKIKGRDNDLTPAFLREHIIGRACVYCGREAAGCDRLDNSLGHLQANVVPSCGACNQARGNRFTYEEMLIIGKTMRAVLDARDASPNPRTQD